MKKGSYYIIVLLFGLLPSCNLYKIVPEGKYLLHKNKIYYREKKALPPKTARMYVLQQPNFYILGYPLWVGIYSIADQNPDSTFKESIRRNPKAYRLFEKIFSAKQTVQLERYYIHLNNQIKKFGQVPVFIDTVGTRKSAENLHILFRNYGFLDNRVRDSIATGKKYKADAVYRIVEDRRYRIDSIYNHFASSYPEVLFNQIRGRMKTRPGRFYDRNRLVRDRDFITSYFRNHGLFDFQSTYLRYDIIKKPDKHYTTVHRQFMNKVEQVADSIYEKPFLPYTYRNIDIYIERSRSQLRNDTSNVKRDTVWKGLHFHYPATRWFRPDLLEKNIFLGRGALYSDRNITFTRKQLLNLRNFKQIYIRQEPVNDTLLDAQVILIPFKKYGIKPSVNVTHSSIRPLGISGEFSAVWRNMFHGFENLTLSYYFQAASSQRFRNPNEEKFFNVKETGLDLSLTVPRVVAPLAGRWIKPFMQPVTTYSVRYTSQTNIGLDREKFYGIYAYQWKPNHIVTDKLTPVEINYVQYKNPDRYFYLYTATFNTLAKLAEQHYNLDITPATAQNFIDFVLNNENPDSDIYTQVKRIYERKVRLTENIFILNTNFSLIYDRRSDIWDSDFYLFKFYFEITGWIPGLISKFSELPVNHIGQKMLNKVPYAQYYKTELTYVRHWDFGKKKILALRLFGGLAIPFGNSTNIPFVSAYFAGGSNDIRAWRAFELGPGSTGGLGEFNEANLKLLFNIEYRMPVYENHHLGIFADAGNIWNIFDDTPYPEARFKGWNSIKEFALGTGIGYRYDFSFFALRLDLAFKNYDPGKPEGERWNFDYILPNAILQFGVNYPF